MLSAESAEQSTEPAIRRDAAPPSVKQSARDIPVAYEVDVVVVGGSTGGVSAAVAAAEQGAKVFLAAPYPYLGEDMTATLRLWLEEGEAAASPLAKSIFSSEIASSDTPHPSRLKYTYESDQPSDARHKDPGNALGDGRWHDIFKESVQYNGDVNLVFDLGKPQELLSFRFMSFTVGDGKNVSYVDTIDISTSDDKVNWTKRGSAKVGLKQIATFLANASAELNLTTRYVKLSLHKHASVTRMLIGEVEFIGRASEDQKANALAPMPRPMHVKSVLDKALLNAGVEFLYSSYVTDLVRDSKNRPCGVVITNRAGRQAILAKTIIDATDRACVARLAGADFRPFPAGLQTLKRVVIGGEILRNSEEAEVLMTARTIAPPFQGLYPNAAKTSSGAFQVIEYTMQLPVEADTPGAWAAADQQARTQTYHPEQQVTADAFYQVPPDAMHGEATSQGKNQDVASLPLDVFRPRGVKNLYVLGGNADISRPQAERLLRPTALIDTGTRLGQAAARDVADVSKPVDPHLAGTPTQNPSAEGDVHEFLSGLRPGQKRSTPAIRQSEGALPVLGEYDVVVIGGGTAGAPAGVGAARQGAKTLVVEYIHGLGGVSTTGYISKYCDGNRVGYTAEIQKGASSWVIEPRMEWHRQTLLEAGADIWFGAMGCGALVEKQELRGAVVTTPQGRGVVLAKVIIDATGNADIAAAAGAKCRYTGQQEFAMQGTGLPPRKLGATYTNTDYTFVDETDMLDVRRAYLQAKDLFADAFDLGQLIDTRERRSIVGDTTLTVCDIIARRPFPDTIQQAVSGYDTHGPAVDTYMLLRHPFRTPLWASVSYRCLLPRGFEGILVTGIGLSAHRDAQPMVRMQPDVQNQGYAAGTAAAMAVKDAVPLRKIDIRKLQQHLVKIGNLKESVLSEVDTFPLSTEEVAEAAERLRPAARAREISPELAIVLSHSEVALPFLRKAYAESDGERRWFHAKVLGMLGDGTGLETLLQLLNQATAWDQSPHYMIKEDFDNWHLVGWEASNLDNTIMAIGRIGDRRAVPALINMVKLLKAPPLNDRKATYFSVSHYRAVAQALSNLRDPRAAGPLADVLGSDDIRGFAQMELGKLVRAPEKSAPIGQYLHPAVRELHLARALYLCGDHSGLGEQILREYAKDLRGHFARHAQAVLGKDFYQD